MFINAKINQINKTLTEQMKAKGCTFYRGTKYEHFKDANGDYKEYPPGFVRGAGTHTMSVQGHRGWHQRTCKTREEAETWALATALEVLAEQPAAEPS